MSRLVEHVESNDLEGLEKWLRSRRAARESLDEALLDAVRLDRARLAALLIRHGADAGQRIPDSGWTLLHVAVENAGLEVVRALVAGGVDVDAPDPTGMTCLHLAVAVAADAVEQVGSAPELALLGLLLKLGASPLVPNEAGETPFDWATESGCPEIVAVFESARGQ